MIAQMHLGTLQGLKPTQLQAHEWVDRGQLLGGTDLLGLAGPAAAPCSSEHLAAAASAAAGLPALLFRAAARPLSTDHSQPHL